MLSAKLSHAHHYEMYYITIRFHIRLLLNLATNIENVANIGKFLRLYT
jgi:hypothetical protein